MSDLLEMLRRHEGLRLMPYKDTVGLLTIGYGRNLEERGISRMEAEFLLKNDADLARADLLQALPQASGWSEDRQNALSDMMFNLGLHRFLRFRKMLEALNQEDFDWAAREMLNSTWAEQVGDRAKELARMVKEG